MPTAGRRRKKQAGTRAKVKRNTASVIGGSVCNAYLMTTKLLPQIATTARASRKWRSGSACEVGAGDIDAV